ncbi:TonB-dependent receptor [Bradyrhizobium sp. SRL28]|uniref:TonB-dependent receptor n=1 Tax=Bradyrhizobium sp. SRL28 TaxID=2836178 RepID=UPI0027E01519|nr:TonB-dependent receptor [Bradyrhizobium sp. SRL28]
MRAFKTTFFLCAASPLALIDISQSAHAQSSRLPPVTIDSPSQRPSAQRAPTRRAGVTRTTVRRSASSQQPVAPVPYVAPSTATLGTVPAPYAGGQVARGAQLGLLGNRSVMDTPFNMTSYTSELMANQQARTVADVLQNDPSVRVIGAAGGGQDFYFIRGFFYGLGNASMNGLFSIAPYYTVGANYIERVELLKGPGALLTGMPPSGAIGGSINLVTKKAPDFDITQLTATYASKSQFGTVVDIARRYGEQKEFGIRFNGGYRNGNSPFDRQNDEFGDAVLGLDYRTERVRVSADLGYQTQNLDPAQRFLSFVDTLIPVPPAPQAGKTFVQPWAHWYHRDTFGMVRGEVDITDWATVYGAVGYNKNELNFISAAPTVLNAAGDYQTRPLIGFSTFETVSAETGIRANVDTGPVNHALSVNYSSTDRPNYNNFQAGTVLFSNIYRPVDTPAQTTGTLTARNTATVRLSSVGVADTVSILDKRVQFTAGVRRQAIEQDNFNHLTSAPTSSIDQSVWSPAFALLVKPVDQLSLYANYIEGLQVGTTVGPGFFNSGQIFPPFQSKQAEVGAKVDFGRITTTLSLFQITQPSVITVVGLPLSSQRVDGEQRNRGVEFNVFGEVTPEVRLLGGVAFIDGRQVRTQNGLNDGKKAFGVPSVQLNLGAEWDTPFVRGLTFGGRVIYTADQFVNPANTQLLPDWVRFDLSARYTFLSPWNGKPIVIRAAVENVANSSYWASAYSGVVTVGAPRTYLVSTTFNF